MEDEYLYTGRHIEEIVMMGWWFSELSYFKNGGWFVFEVSKANEKPIEMETPHMVEGLRKILTIIKNIPKQRMENFKKSLFY